MSDDDPQILKPGFASDELPEVTEIKQKATRPELATAHYVGMTAEQAESTWNDQTLCTTCAAMHMCKVAMHCPDALVMITRCLAYIPGVG